MYNYMWGLGMGWFGMILWLAFWIFIVWIVIRLVQEGGSKKEDPEDIAKARYAKGEISKKEYEEIKDELEK